jgi:hypothetical protein
LIEMGSCEVCLSWSGTTILVSSWVARIAGVSHSAWPELLFLFSYFSCCFSYASII